MRNSAYFKERLEIDDFTLFYGDMPINFTFDLLSLHNILDIFTTVCNRDLVEQEEYQN